MCENGRIFYTVEEINQSLQVKKDRLMFEPAAKYIFAGLTIIVYIR